MIVRPRPGALYLRSRTRAWPLFPLKVKQYQRLSAFLSARRARKPGGDGEYPERGRSEATVAAHCYSPSTALSVTEEAGEGGRADGMGRVSLLGAT